MSTSILFCLWNFVSLQLSLKNIKHGFLVFDTTQQHCSNTVKYIELNQLLFQPCSEYAVCCECQSPALYIRHTPWASINASSVFRSSQYRYQDKALLHHLTARRLQLSASTRPAPPPPPPSAGKAWEGESLCINCRAVTHSAGWDDRLTAEVKTRRDEGGEGERWWGGEVVLLLSSLALCISMLQHLSLSLS